jgi:molybdopterin-binding protein
MLPRPGREAHAIVAAFSECSLGLERLDRSGLDFNASSWVQRLEDQMNTTGAADPSGRDGLWLVKARTFGVDEQAELTRIIDELAEWFDRYLAGCRQVLDAAGPAYPSSLSTQASARNQFIGTVTSVRSGAVNDEVEIKVSTGQRITAVVTRESTQSLGLRNQTKAMALVKSSSVILARDLQGAKLSTRNQLPGKVRTVSRAPVNAEVVMDLDGGGSITAIVTSDSVQSLGLAPGTPAVALFKASSVIVAVKQ